MVGTGGVQSWRARALAALTVAALAVSSLLFLATPAGAASGAAATVVLNTATPLSGYSVDPTITGTVRVLLRATDSTGSLQVTSYAGLTGIRNTANFTTTAGASTLGTAGRMIGLVGTAAAVNTALATLSYTGTALGSDTVTMYVSNGAEYDPIVQTVNGTPTLGFRYFGAYSSGAFMNWNSALSDVSTRAFTINGVSTTGAYLAAPAYASEEALISSMTSTSGYSTSFTTAPRYWFGATNTATGVWKYASGTDLAGTTFFTGQVSTGSSWTVSPSYVANPDASLNYDGTTNYYTNWAPSATTDKNGFTTYPQPDSASGNGAEFIWVNAASPYLWEWNDSPYTGDTTSSTPEQGYIWEVNAAAPIGQSTTVSAANYTTSSTQTITVSAAPSNSVVPSVTGTPAVGQSLTGAIGTWSANNSAVTSTSEQWQNSPDGSTWTNVSGATSLSYTAQGSDAGKYLRVQVTETNGMGSTTASSAATAIVTSANSTTIVSGTALSGYSVNASTPGTVRVLLRTSNSAGLLSVSSYAGLTGILNTANYSATSGSSTLGTAGQMIGLVGSASAINTALATLSYSGTAGQTDVVSMWVSNGAMYIPVVKSGQVAFHYFGYVSASDTWSAAQTAAATAQSIDGVSVTPFLATPVNQAEDGYLDAYIGTGGAWFGATTTAVGGTWTWAGGPYAGTAFWSGTTSGSALNGSYTNWGKGSSQLEPSGDGLCANDWYNTGYTANTVASIAWNDAACSTSLSYLWEYSTGAPLGQSTSATAASYSSGASVQTVRTVAGSGAPTSVTATAASTTSVTVAWTAPASTGTDALSDYTVQYSTDNATWSAWPHTASTATTQTVTGLSSGTTYYFRVAAVTSVTGTFSSSVGTSTGVVAVAQSGSSGSPLSGFSVPSTTTGTVRVLLRTSNPNGQLWSTNTSALTGGIRNTANYPTTAYSGTSINYSNSTLGASGQMVGYVGTAANVNLALAALRYSSPSASSDSVAMWVSNGSEYVPVAPSTSSANSAVQFKYYGYVSGSVTESQAASSSYAGAARSVDGVSLAAGTPFLATAQYPAEDQYMQTLVGSNNAWLNATGTSGTSSGVWSWWGPDASGVQFWSGLNSGSALNGQYTNWGRSAATGSQVEPNGDSGSSTDCLDYGSGYSYPSTSTDDWNDASCTTNQGYVWAAINVGAPYGSQSNAPGSSYYSASTNVAVTTYSVPGVPTAVTATSTTSGQVNLAWSAPSSSGSGSISGYTVQYSPDGVNWTTATSSTTGTSFAVTGLTPGSYYHFRVGAINATGTGPWASAYAAPTGSGATGAIVATAKTIGSLQLPSADNSLDVRVLLRASASTSTLAIANYSGLAGGVRGTANYSATAGSSTLGTAGQMVGLVGTGSAVNTALASLVYTGSAVGSDTISMWVSVGTSSAYPQEYDAIVNVAGQVEFHYFWSSSSMSSDFWTERSAAPSTTLSINGQSVTGGFLATDDNADQNALVSAAMTAGGVTNTRAWLNAGASTTVSLGNGQSAWYWLGPDTGVTNFYNGTYATGSGALVSGMYSNWGASSSAQGEPNSPGVQNCLAAANGTTYSNADVNGSIVTIAAAGGATWDDSSCSTSYSPVIEYVAAAPVGTSTVGANNSAAESALAVTVTPSVTAPTGVAATAAGTTQAQVVWTAPATVYSSSAISGYSVQYSTSSSFATFSTYTASASATSVLITGLTAGTTYYFRVTAVAGTAGTASASVSATTPSSAVKVTIVASGGVSAGSGYTLAGGILSAPSSVSINASDVAADLASGNLNIAADAVVVAAPVSWTANTVLTLGGVSSVAVNSNITASGATAGVVIVPSSYALSTKTGASIVLSGSSPSFTLGGTGYTVVNTVAELLSVGAISNDVLGAPLTMSSALTASPIASFYGTFDGLGNTVSGLTIAPTAAGNYGLFGSLGGATVRNLGVTGANLSTSTASINVAFGAIAGNGSATSATSTLTQVWSTGFISDTGSGDNVWAGGLVGGATAGTLNISLAYSTVNINTNTATVGSGGLIGTNVGSYLGSNNTGAALTISQAYSTGNIGRVNSASWYGNGGIIGVAYGTVTTLSDVFSWGSITSGGTYSSTSTAGIIGWGSTTSTTSVTRAYTTASTCAPASTVTVTNCSTGVTTGATVTGLTTSAWVSSPGTVLANVPSPTQNLYVQVVAPTNGAYSTMGFQVTDGVGNVQTLSSLNLTVSGTPVYSGISTSPIVGTYSVLYASGLILGGTNAASYTLLPWPTATSVTISSVAAGAPTGVSVTTVGDTSLTLGWTAPTSNNGGTLSAYEVDYSSNGGTTWTAASTSIAGTATSYTVTGLTDGTAYLLQVRASAGLWGAFTQTSAASTPYGVPLNTAVPSIATPTVGTSTTANPGTWNANGSAVTGYSYQWQSSTTLSGTYTSISGATAASYTPGASLGGTYLRVEVEATNARGTATAWAVSTGALIVATSAPTGVTASAAGTTQAQVSWTAPTSVYSSSAISGYSVQYSTSSTFATSSTSTASASATSALITGLTAGTTYYFQVTPIAGGPGTTSSVVSATTPTSAVTVTIVASGGVSAGSGYTLAGGILSAPSSVSINASDVAADLASGNLNIAADAVVVAAPVSWSANTVLTLGGLSSVAVNSNLTASGVTAGVVIVPSSYSLATKTGASIVLSGASPSFTLGGTGYTVVNTVAKLLSVGAISNDVLGAPLTMTSTLTTSPIPNFYGTFDGLGNTVSGLTMTPTAAGNYGLFGSLGGATVRNLGVTGVNLSTSTASINVALGAIAGNASATSATSTLTQVWSSGFIAATGSGDDVWAGGLVGGATAGTLNISLAYSTVNITTSTASAGTGGLIGTNVSAYLGSPSSGATLTISQAYSTGNIARNITNTWYGSGGIIGIAFGVSTVLSDVFSWGSITSTGVGAGTSTAGIIGVGSTTSATSITRAYTTNSACSGSNATATSCSTGVTIGSAVTGLSSAAWAASPGTLLANLPAPTQNLYVQVVAPTNGAYSTMGYQVTDGGGNVPTLSSLGLTVSGTPVYSGISTSPTAATYSVLYASGLTLGGTNAGLYTLQPWPTATSVTISSVAAGAPTGVSVTTVGDGSLTLGWTAPTSNSGGTLSAYEVDYSSDGGNTWTAASTSIAPSATSYTVTGLTDGTAYLLQVRASAGLWGAFTQTSAASTPYGLPLNTAAPSVASAAVGTAATLSSTGTWNANGSAVTGYIYQWQSSSTLSGTYTNISSATASSYTPGASLSGAYLRVEVEASNARGTATAWAASTGVLVAAGAPLAPTSVVATAGSASGALSLSWTAPSTLTSGGTIASYTVQYSTDNATWTTAATGLTGTSATITGLTNGTAYYVQVQAVNTAGAAGAWGAQGSTVTPYWAPINSAAPTLSGSAVGGLSLSESNGTWSTNGSTVTATTRQWQLSADGVTWTNISGATGASYIALASQAGQYLRVAVSETNAAGTTVGYSAASAAVQSGLASAPQSLTVTTGNGQLAVGWAAPATTNGGTVSGYTVEYSTNGSSWTVASSAVAASATSSTVTGLTNGTGYYIGVLATTAGGAGTLASTTGTTTPYTSPSNSVAPTITGTAAAGNTVSVLSNGIWSNGGNAASYSYQWQSASSLLGPWVAIAGATGSSYAVQSSDAGSYLQVVVTATNLAGSASAPSLASALVTSGLAAAPSGVASTPGNGQLALSWVAPTVLNGGTVSDFTVQTAVAGSGAWSSFAHTASTGTSMTVTGLTNGTAYDVRVAAVTAAGTGVWVTYPADATTTPRTVASNSVLPTVTGLPAVGVALGSSIGTWSNGGATAVTTYQWQTSSGSSGSNWTAISGATSSAYTPVVGDVGNELRLVVTETNAAGAVSATSAATAVVQSGLASAPQNLAVTLDNTALDLSWAVPSTTDGGTISGYTVQYSTDGATWTTASTAVSAGATSYQVTGLTNGTAYYSRVWAVTAAGAGAIASTTSTTTPAGVPTNTAVPVLTVQSGQPGVGQVVTSTVGTWNTNGSAISATSYQWQTDSGSTGATWTNIAGATGESYTPVVADIGSELQLVVTEQNAAGWSLSATSAATAVTASGLASAPTSVAAFQTGVGGITVSWSAPTSWNGGALASWGVDYSTDGVNWTTASSSVASSSSSYRVTGLTGGTAYQFRVYALTARGTGAYGTVSATAIGTPVNTALPTSTGNATSGYPVTAVHGTWTVPGGSASSLVYTDRFQVFVNSQWTSVGSANTAYTVGGSYVGYQLRVSESVSYGGFVTVIAYSSVVTIASGSPSAPRSVAATATGGGQLTVHWAAPASLNGAIVSAYELDSSTDQSTWTAASTTIAANATSYAVSGLTGGTAYYFRVRVLVPTGITTLWGTSSAVTAIATPTNAGLPTVTGMPAVGVALGETDGTWAPGGAAITPSYQWQTDSSSAGVNWTNITGATNNSYVPVVGDIGSELRLVVTETNSVATASATSAATAAVASGLAGASSAVSSTPGNGQLALSWVAPTALNGGVISDYAVQTAVSGTGNWSSFAHSAGTGTSMTVTGLANGTAYDVRVAAVTAAGLGPWLTYPADATTTPRTVPSNSALPTVSGIPAVGVALGSSIGTWSNGGALAVTTYQWQTDSGSAGASWTAISGATSSAYTPVLGDVGSELQLVVTETNAAGAVSATSAATAVVQSGLASAPQNLAVTLDNTALDLSWAAPSTTDGGTISGYTVQYSTDGTTWTTASTAVTAGATSYQVTGLSNGTAYYSRLWAVTAAGAGAVASTTSATTPAGLPTNTAVPVLTVQHGQPGVGQVVTSTVGTWNTNGAAITATSYQWQTDSRTAGGTWTNIAGATGASYTPVVADIGSELQLVVTEQNAAGWSLSATSAATAVTASGLTSAPTSVTANPTAVGVVTVAWGAPTSWNGGALASWEVDSSTDGVNWTTASSSIPSSSSSYQVTGLTGGTAYQFRVYALTARGTGAVGTTSATAIGSPVNTALPTFTGTVAVGYSLTPNNGTWSVSGGAVSSYSDVFQISPDGTNWTSVGTANSAYALANSGYFVRLAESVGYAFGTSVTVYSASSTIGSGVPSAPQNVAATATASGQVSVTWAAPANLNGATGLSYVVEYSTDGSTWSGPVSAASTSSVFTSLTVGDSYFFEVQAVPSSGTTYHSAVAVTPSATTVIGPPTNSALPAVTGTPAVGIALSGSDGTWALGGAAITPSYQWQTDSGTGGVTWTNVSGATSNSYTPVVGDIGSQLRLVVTETNTFATASATSSATAVVASGLADVPSGLSSTPGNGQLAISWTAPSTLNGGVISDYAVQTAVAGSGNWVAFAHSAGTGTSMTVTGLSNGTAYDVRVAAVTAAGIGAWMTSPADLTTTPRTVPSNSVLPTVTGTPAVGVALGSTDGTWSTGGAVAATTYQWQTDSGSAGTSWTAISGATGSTYTPVTADVGSELRLVVTQTNAAGSVSATSAPTVVVETGLASAPQNLSISSGDGRLAVSWAAPVTTNGGTITGYEVDTSPDGLVWTTAATGVTGLGHTVTALSNGTGYLVRVTASTAAGAGASATTQSATVPAGVPSGNGTAPTISGTPLLGQVLSVSLGGWNANGAAVSGALYQWQSSGNGLTNWTPVSGATASTLQIGTANLYYRAEVWAMNSAGTAVTPEVSAASAFTVSVAPSFPSGLTVVPGDGQLSVSWSAPTQLGGGTLSGYDLEYSTDGVNWTPVPSQPVASATSATITGLVNGTQYTVELAGISTVEGSYADSGWLQPYGAPINLGLPSVSGTAHFGSTLYEGGDSWADNGSTLTAADYQWQSSADGGASWQNVPGATGSGYQIGALVGELLRVEVTRTDAAGLATTVASAATGAVAAVAPTAPTGLSVASGDQQLGVSWSAPTNLGGSALNHYVLQYSAVGGTWTTASNSIAANAGSFQVTGLVNGTAYSVRLWAVTSLTGAAVTSATPTVPAGSPILLTSPAITGTAQYGQTLSAGGGSWAANGAALNPTTVQWQQNSGSGWVAIPGAVTGSFIIGGQLVGATLRAEITSSNSAGQTVTDTAPTAVVIAAPASAPVGISASGGDHQLSLSWSAPAYLGGAAVSSYQVQYSIDQNTWTTLSPAPTGTSAVITGLANGTPYFVQVAALNGVTGAAASTGATPFGAPIDTAVPTVSGSAVWGLTLSANPGNWDANGSAVTSTSYTWQAFDGTSWNDIPQATGTSASSYTVAGYIGQSIRVVVTVTDLDGLSSTVASAATLAVVAGQASAPSAIIVTPGDHQLSLAWTVPTNTGGSAITDYQVQLSTDGTTWSGVTRAPSTVTGQVVTGLSNGVNYLVRVRALNGSQGAWGSLVSSAVPRGLPIETTQPSVAGTPAYESTLTASPGSWDANGDTLQAPQYQWQSSTDGVAWTDLVGATDVNYIVGAVVGAQLRVIVTEANAAGPTAAASSASAPVVGIPAAAPAVTVQQIGNAQLSLAWTAPADLGGTALAGYTLQFSTDQSSWTSVSLGAGLSSTVVTGLANGTSYFLRMRAQTAFDGAWSNAIGPYQPVAPVVPVASSSVSGGAVAGASSSASSAASTGSVGTTTDDSSALTDTVMPVAPSTTTLNSLTGSGSVTVLDDGRIELAPTQSVVLVNGQPAAAEVRLGNGVVTVKSKTMSVQLAFSAAVAGTAEIVAGGTAKLRATGFASGSPFVSWIQSTPTKLGQATVAGSGEVSTEITLPRGLAAGQHTLQFNSRNAAGQIVSVIYGVHVIAAPVAKAGAGFQLAGRSDWPLAAYLLMFGLVFALLTILFGVKLRSRRSRARR